MSDVLMAFYGDDFTGSTDAMDALSKAGIPTVLFLEPPDLETLDKQPDEIRAVGVAGTSRSMSPDEMRATLPSTLEQLASLDVPVVHYKICSTFDSAPDVGSIGCTIDLAMTEFRLESVPVLPAAPPLGRYVVFGNMFARDGESVYRLDRHPTMTKHPITPMDESDLSRHLAEQTDTPISVVSVLSLQSGVEEAKQALQECLDRDSGIVILDALDRSHMRTAGGLIWEQYGEDTPEPAFVIGSSGVEYALVDHWKQTGIVETTPQFAPLPPSENTFVLSGSASPRTAEQITNALEHGFVGVRIATEALVDPTMRAAEFSRLSTEIVDALVDGDSVVAYTARGPDDDAIRATKARTDALSDPPSDLGSFLGTKEGELLRTVVSEAALDRVCVAGGDTCGHVTPHLDVYALRSRFPLSPGAPLCTALSDDETFDEIEIALKGGQLGDPNYFVRVRDGEQSWETAD